MSVKELSVKLEGLEISDKDMAALEKEINAVVLKHIAATKQPQLVGSLVGSAAAATPVSPTTKLNPKWLGIWLKGFANKQDMIKVNYKAVATLNAHV